MGLRLNVNEELFEHTVEAFPLDLEFILLLNLAVVAVLDGLRVHELQVALRDDLDFERHWEVLLALQKEFKFQGLD